METEDRGTYGLESSAEEREAAFLEETIGYLPEEEKNRMTRLRQSRDPRHSLCAYHFDLDCRYPHHIPTRRPIAEPPMFDYDDFIENKLPSDIRYSKLFPGNVEKWVRFRDHETEELLLQEFRLWADNMKCYEGDPARRAFYHELHQEVMDDYVKVAEEAAVAMKGMSPLGYFEYMYLDQDGRTLAMEAWTTEDWKAVRPEKEAWAKYGHLAPPGFEPTHMHWYCEQEGIECGPGWCTGCPKNDRWDAPSDNSSGSSQKTALDTEDVPIIGQQDEEGQGETLLDSRSSVSNTVLWDVAQLPVTAVTDQGAQELEQELELEQQHHPTMPAEETPVPDEDFHQQLFDAMYL